MADLAYIFVYQFGCKERYFFSKTETKNYELTSTIADVLVRIQFRLTCLNQEWSWSKKNKAHLAYLYLFIKKVVENDFFS
jgi:hypothetical protein